MVQGGQSCGTERSSLEPERLPCGNETEFAKTKTGGNISGNKGTNPVNKNFALDTPFKYFSFFLSTSSAFHPLQGYSRG